MVQKLLPIGLAETKKLIWIIAPLLALIVTLQFFEFPYRDFVSTSASTGAEKKNGDSSPKFENVSNYTDSTSIVHPEVNQTSDSSLNEDNRGDKDSPIVILKNQNLTLGSENVSNVDDEEEEAREPEPSFNGNNGSSIGIIRNETSITSSAPIGSFGESVFDKNVSIGDSNTSLVENEISNTNEEKERPEVSLGDLGPSADTNLTKIALPEIEKRTENPILDVYSLSDMDDLLLQSHKSYYSVKPRWSSKVDRELRDAMIQIENAPIVQNDPNLYAPLYRNVSMFKRSYELMEKILKVYVYKEGARPVLHTPFLMGLYASEGWFMKQLESNKRFVTKNPKSAHMFYLPFSSRMLEEALYVVGSHSHKNLVNYLKNYVDLIAGKYPHWNRTEGADHFFAACHDWAPSETRKIMAKCIRALCNSDVKEGFVFGKDVSLPETYIRSPKSPLRDVGGKPHSKRTTLAFFAGSMHGYLRPVLLHHWENNKDPDIKVFGKLPKSKNNKVYADYMKGSKFCICAKGYEVNSPRVVEAIFYECVPVIISDNFVPPFFGVLNWESFAVFVAEKDIPELKKILSTISDKKYRELQMNVKRVQKHFLWHSKPEKYDIFHMILHSIWYNRLHQITVI